MRQQIPNLLTMANLFCGCCAVVFLLYGQPVMAAWLTLGSFLFDYTDGMVARALGVADPLGRELDSLADVVSFGVAPGAMIYGVLTAIYCPAASPGFFSWSPETDASTALNVCLAALPAFVLSMFAAYRLARFNLDTAHRNYFIGLSTPGCTLFVLGLTLAVHNNQFGTGAFIAAQPWLLYLVIGIFSYLMVSNIPMFGLKFRSVRWQENKMPYVFLALSLAALIFLKGLGLSLVILFYILASIFSKNTILGAGSAAKSR